MKNVLFFFLTLLVWPCSHVFSAEAVAEIEAVWKTEFARGSGGEATFSYIATSDNNIWFIDYKWKGKGVGRSINWEETRVEEDWQVGDLIKLTEEIEDWKMSNLSQNREPITVSGPYSSIRESYFDAKPINDWLSSPSPAPLTTKIDVYKGKINIIKDFSKGNEASYLKLKDHSHWKSEKPEDILNLKDGDSVTIILVRNYSMSFQRDDYYLNTDGKAFKILPR